MRTSGKSPWSPMWPASSDQSGVCQYLSEIECLMSPSRFGVAESHGRGAALQLNTFLEDGAVSYNSSSGKYEVRQLPGHQSSEQHEGIFSSG